MIISNEVIDSSNSYVKQYYQDHYTSDYTYHNYRHVQQVQESVRTLGVASQLQEEDIKKLIVAATFHDIGYHKDRVHHEEISADMAATFLKEKGLSDEVVSEIKEIIRATKLDWKGFSQLGTIIRDADLSHLASKNYDEINENLRKEMQFSLGKNISAQEWRLKNIEFYNNHSYQSNAGKQLYAKKKKKNLKRLEKIVSGEVEPDSTQTIATSKSAQTQVKTALRNHIDLSSIADNKANMMLTISAMVLTVGLPLLLSNTTTIPELIIPSAIIALTCIVSMVYATLATRPIDMKGVTDLDDIPKKKTNLFFFGNFYKMPYSDYSKGIDHVIADDEVLEDSITRDLFFLGVSLGKKYDHLRRCYNIFMIGMVLAVISGIIVFGMKHLG